MIAVIPRFLTQLVQADGELPIAGQLWEDTALKIPNEFRGLEFRNVLTGEALPSHEWTEEPGIPLSTIMKTFPITLFCSEK